MRTVKAITDDMLLVLEIMCDLEQIDSETYMRLVDIIEKIREKVGDE